MLGEPEIAYYLGKEDGEFRALLGLSEQSDEDLSWYNDTYLFGYHKGYEILDDYDKGFAAGYADAYAGRPRNTTILALSRPFRAGYLAGFDDYIDASLRYRHEESEAAA